MVDRTWQDVFCSPNNSLPKPYRNGIIDASAGNSHFISASAGTDSFQQSGRRELSNY